MVISEMVAATNGIGYFMLESQRTFAIPEMWSGFFLLGILGYGLNAHHGTDRETRAALAPRRPSERTGVKKKLMLTSRHLGKTYGEGAQPWRRSATCSWRSGGSEFVCVVGPSGCGKTTLLKCVSGLLPPRRGR